MFSEVATGTWLHDGSTPMPVQIIESDRDFWFDLAHADGNAEPDERPHLNEHGLCYYILFNPVKGRDSFWPGSVGSLSLDEARAVAASKVPAAISWDD